MPQPQQQLLRQLSRPDAAAPSRSHKMRTRNIYTQSYIFMLTFLWIDRDIYIQSINGEIHSQANAGNPDGYSQIFNLPYYQAQEETV